MQAPSSRQTQFQSQLAHLVFEKALERFDERELHVLGKPADVVMALDERGGIARDGHGLDHVGIQRALREELRFARALGGGLENIDERFADDLAFALGIADAAQLGQKQRGRLLVLQLHFEIATKDLLHDLGLARAQ